MLRDIPEPRRKGLIGGLPTTVALASALLLGYADDTLGACADPDVVALPADTRVEFALERVRDASGTLAFVCVVDADRRLNAIVELTTLLKAPASATLATLLQRPHDRLPANTPLEAAAVHAAWQHTSALPVVERGGRLVGVVTRDALARALRRGQPPAPDDAEMGLPALLARGYWQALSGLIESGLVLLPRVPSLAEGRDGQ